LAIFLKKPLNFTLRPLIRQLAYEQRKPRFNHRLERKNMSGLNRVILIGRLGRDPEEKKTGGGTTVSNFSIATDHFRGSNGGKEKITEWHRIVAYGKIAEQCNSYLRKGRLACVEGALQTRSWEKPQGEKHFITEVVASRVTFLDSHGSAGGGTEGDIGESAIAGDFQDA
jgi:single-strand DNA-binding protein